VHERGRADKARPAGYAVVIFTWHEKRKKMKVNKILPSSFTLDENFLCKLFHKEGYQIKSRMEELLAEKWQNPEDAKNAVDYIYGYTCKRCGQESQYSNYCSSCGAKMLTGKIDLDIIRNWAKKEEKRLCSNCHYYKFLSSGYGETDKFCKKKNVFNLSVGDAKDCSFFINKYIIMEKRAIETLKT